MNALKSADCSDERGVEQIAPIDGDSSLSSRTVPGCSRGACDDCSEILHGLNNVLASMLLNAQVMEWKLPSYSRSKRYLHEIERNAQRGGELVRRLLARMQEGCEIDVADAQDCGEAPTLAGADVAATRESAVLVRAVDVPPRIEAHTAPVFLSSRKKVPHTIV